MSMEILEVENSATVHTIGYDVETKKISVAFHNGSLYEYDGNDDIWEGLKNAPSKGKYIHTPTFRKLSYRKVL